ncbi:unnamed protein product [Schistocephalus solidus]|uniref:Uncharacterized protein n=1 Tax=Schistocephalus solidus TaxID=70667 RepID=A0A183SXU9_SCHSO|nr:unnamed protein product [Schistocephalus solidus]
MQYGSGSDESPIQPWSNNDSTSVGSGNRACFPPEEASPVAKLTGQYFPRTHARTLRSARRLSRDATRPAVCQTSMGARSGNDMKAGMVAGVGAGSRRTSRLRFLESVLTLGADM